MAPMILHRRVTLRYRLLFIGVAAICAAVAQGVFVFYGRPPDMSDIVSGVCALAGFAALAGLFHHDQLWTLDETTVTVRNRTMFYAYTRSWPMRAVSTVRVRAGDGDEPRGTWYAELRLASGKRLTLPRCKDRDRCDEIARQIEAWNSRS